MRQPIIPRDQVAQHLAVPPQLLIRYEARGLIHTVREGSLEGYDPSQIRRLWTILSCQRDLGINLAGVEAVLKLRDHLAEIHRQLDALALRLREALDDQPEPGPDA